MVKGGNSKIPSIVVGSCDSKEIPELFSEKYHIILMIYMLLKLQYLIDYKTVKMIIKIFLIMMLLMRCLINKEAKSDGSRFIFRSLSSY